MRGETVFVEADDGSMIEIVYDQDSEKAYIVSYEDTLRVLRPMSEDNSYRPEAYNGHNCFVWDNNGTRRPYILLDEEEDVREECIVISDDDEGDDDDDDGEDGEDGDDERDSDSDERGDETENYDDNEGR
ncbi:hypothetical protein HK104_005130, partial [Borealophlyctis nickersoniae]